eukprot:TRINITY_DN3257_c0_g1_i3.p1 TRINITY_DN3257_c0_g1~~TRINITY_DN3257_c0_g1_i3.p1  ORF type:complete len:401 (+),score=68.39 TRINITY_DN3257_c0_g1_i3:36-1205(+)
MATALRPEDKFVEVLNTLANILEKSLRKTAVAIVGINDIIGIDLDEDIGPCIETAKRPVNSSFGPVLTVMRKTVAVQKRIQQIHQILSTECKVVRTKSRILSPTPWLVAKVGKRGSMSNILARKHIKMGARRRSLSDVSLEVDDHVDIQTEVVHVHEPEMPIPLDTRDTQTHTYTPPRTLPTQAGPPSPIMPRASIMKKQGMLRLTTMKPDVEEGHRPIVPPASPPRPTSRPLPRPPSSTPSSASSSPRTSDVPEVENGGGSSIGFGGRGGSKEKSVAIVDLLDQIDMELKRERAFVKIDSRNSDRKTSKRILFGAPPQHKPAAPTKGKERAPPAIPVRGSEKVAPAPSPGLGPSYAAPSKRVSERGNPLPTSFRPSTSRPGRPLSWGQ